MTAYSREASNRPSVAFGYGLTLLTAIHTLNYTDRAVFGLLLQSIKTDLDLSDTQLGFVTGIAFALFYATLGVPIARWSDRGNRVNIASMFMALWGVTVMATGLVVTFAQLVIARIAAAAGEAGCIPPTYSLVGDYFPEASARTRAMAIYMIASPLASIFAFVAGGFLNEQIGWRQTIAVIGVPGIVVALLARFTLTEPRQAAPDPPVKSDGSPLFQKVLRAMWQVRSCRHLTVALILLYAVGLGLSPWYAAFLIRAHDMTTGELGLWFGGIFGIGGIVGVLLGGLMPLLKRAAGEKTQMRICALSVALLTPAFAAFLLAPGKYGAMAGLIPITLGFAFLLGPAFALLQRLVPGDMRASVMAVFMLLANLIGMGLGPQIVGILSDRFQESMGEDALRYAMLCLAGLPLWSAVHLWIVGGIIDDDLAETRPGHQPVGVVTR
jgi:MFS family permease